MFEVYITYTDMEPVNICSEHVAYYDNIPLKVLQYEYKHHLTYIYTLHKVALDRRGWPFFRGRVYALKRAPFSIDVYFSGSISN